MWKRPTLAAMILCLSQAAYQGALAHTSDFNIAHFNVSNVQKLTVTGSGGTYNKIEEQNLVINTFINAAFYGHSSQNLTHKIKSAFLHIPGNGGKYTENAVNQTTLLSLNHYPSSIVGSRTVHMATWKLNMHRAGIVAACNKIIANGGSPSKDHTASYNLPLQLVVKAGQGSLFKRYPFKNFITRFSKVTKTISFTCKALKAPPRAGAKIEITKFSVVADAGSTTCPRRHDVKLAFRAVGAKSVQYRIRTNNTTVPYRTLNLTKTAETEKGRTVYVGTVSAVLRLNHGKTELQAMVKNGPKSAEKVVTVNCGPFKVIGVSLKFDYKGQYCPMKVTETATYTANRHGSFRYKIIRKDGKVMVQGRAMAKRKGNVYVAVIKRPLSFPFDYETKYMAEATSLPHQVVKFGANSGWRTLKIACLKMKEAKLVLTDPQNKGERQCPRKGKLAAIMKFNRAGVIAYRMACTNGFSTTGKATIRKGKLTGNHRAIVSRWITVKEKGDVTCALQDADHGNRLIAMTKKFFDCRAPVAVNPGADDVAPADAARSRWPQAVLEGLRDGRQHRDHQPVSARRRSGLLQGEAQDSGQLQVSSELLQWSGLYRHDGVVQVGQAIQGARRPHPAGHPQAVHFLHVARGEIGRNEGEDRLG